MTDIAHMPAGAEMDRLVAEKVMGHDTFSISPCERLQEARIGSDGGANGTRTLAGYSTNIAHAWEVVEKVAELKPDMDCSMRSNSNGFFASFHSYRTTPIPPDMEMAESMPLAICRAALLAVGEK